MKKKKLSWRIWGRMAMEFFGYASFSYFFCGRSMINVRSQSLPGSGVVGGRRLEEDHLCQWVLLCCFGYQAYLLIYMYFREKTTSDA